MRKLDRHEGYMRHKRQMLVLDNYISQWDEYDYNLHPILISLELSDNNSYINEECHYYNCHEDYIRRK